MIIVTGATGKLGRSIVEQLAKLVPASQVGASVRDPEKAHDLAVLGVRVRRGDFTDPASLPHAFEGATQLLIVSSNAAAHGGNPLTQHRAAIDAARDAGVRRIVYTSHMAASRTSAFPPMLDHAATEEMLRGSGLAWTALRNGFYADNAFWLMGDSFQTGRIDAPSDGKVSWTAHADLADAAAIVLNDEGKFDGPTPPLTGSEALDLTDLFGIASELQARPIARHTISDEQYLETKQALGMPGHIAERSLGLYRASRAGEFVAVDPTLAGLLGRNPIRMRDLMAKRVAG